MFFRLPEKTGLLFALLVLFLAGCDTRNQKVNGYYLLRIGEIAITEGDYLEALEVMKASYPYGALQDKQVEKTLKTRLLKQLTEELILSKRAAELGLSVSADELNKAVQAVKEDYPDKVFEKMLLEKAISFHAWEKRVEMRLLAEKVIDRELVATVNLTPEEVEAFYSGNNTANNTEAGLPETIDADFVKQLRREKAQKQYPQWIDGLQQQYDIELNEQLWKTIFD